jgi:class 3 adenylate cyclase/predicted ATPase
VEEWLRSIGLGHRAEAFRAERIEREQLPDLTEDDLKELGLTIGERRRFRRAVLELSNPPPPPLPSTLTERRPLTMMFVDLVGSSALGEDLEPEDLLEVIRLYREACGEAIRRFGGSIARQVGDGILAYFSYPVATENDPERAVRAALDIVRDIGHLASPAPLPLQVRIGIATGRVIISDMLAGGTADLRTIIGSPPNLAARLQGMAQPGGIVIAPETHERVRDAFACEDLGQIEMRGFAAPRQAWRVLHELPRRGWRPSARPQRLTPFCARRAELAFLGEHWSLATRGAGRAVLIGGEAGIGKSRLIETFLALNCLEDCRVLQLGGSPFDVDSALLPFAAWLRDESTVVPGPEPGTNLAGAEPLGGTDLADLLGIGPAASGLAHTPAQLRELMLGALTERLLAFAGAEPLCLVVEDAHWLDPSSLELLERLVARIAGRRVMLLLSARDGFEAAWLSHPAVSTLRLARLGPEDVAAIVRGLVDRAALPAALVEQLVRKSDGVPLFVVELLRGLLNPDGSAAATLPGFALPDEPDADIPVLLRDSLMARLDRAGLAKEVAQIAAVLGRSVRPGMLSAVAGRPVGELDRPLAALVGAGVLFRDGGGPSETYTFTHALLRDAAYDSVVRDQRQSLHLRVADALPRLDPKAVEQQPELLALHLSEGGRPEAAAPHWMEAARRSLTRSALTEATRLLDRGLAGLAKAAPGEARTDLRLRMLALLGPALLALRGPGSAEAQELYASAYRQAQDVPEDLSHFPIYWGWWRISRDFGAKVERAEALLGRARLRADDGLLLQAHHCAWASQYCVGALAQSRDHAVAGLALYEAGDYRDHARLYGNHDARVCAHGELSEIYWLQGRPLRALAQEREAMAWAHELKHLGSLAHALDYRLIHRTWRRDLADVYALAGEMASFATEHALADHHAKALIFRGWAMAMSEDLAAGRRMLEEGIARQHDIGTDEDFPIYSSLLAEVLLRAGDAGHALEEVQRARAEFSRIGLSVAIPELVRLHGEALLATNPGAGAEALARFAEAQAMAEAQGGDMMGLRAAVSAARLLLRLGDPAEGARRLGRALASLPENDGGADRLEADALAARFRLLGMAA